MDKFLQEGEQTKITKLVKWHVEKIDYIQINHPSDLDKNLIIALKTSKYIAHLPKIKGYISHPQKKEEIDKQRNLKDSIFRKRTLDQILKEGYFPTCSDIGILFRGFMIAQGVPTAYVETFHEDYLLGKSFTGHVIGKVFSNGRWYFVDPQNIQRGVIEKEFEIFPLIVFREGLDSWDIGIKGYDDMHKAKRENIKELMEEYKRVLKSNYEKKMRKVDEIIKDPILEEIKMN